MLIFSFWIQILVQSHFPIWIYNPYKCRNLLNSISPVRVRSGRTRPAILGVRSCPGWTLICPVRLSPKILAGFRPVGSIENFRLGHKVCYFWGQSFMFLWAKCFFVCLILKYCRVGNIEMRILFENLKPHDLCIMTLCVSMYVL